MVEGKLMSAWSYLTVTADLQLLPGIQGLQRKLPPTNVNCQFQLAYKPLTIYRVITSSSFGIPSLSSAL